MTALLSFCLGLAGVLCGSVVTVLILSKHENIRDLQVKVSLRNGFEIKSRFYKQHKKQ